MSSFLSRLFAAATTNEALDPKYYGGAGASMSAAGMPITPEGALRVAAVYRCVSIKANILAFMPFGMYEDRDGDSDTRNRRRAREHPLDAVIRFRPNSRQTSFEWRRQLNVSLMLRQNAYCQIVPAEKPGAFELIPLHPDRLRGPDMTPGGELRWTYTPPAGGKPVPLLEGIDLWHLQGLSEDGIKGLAMTELAKNAFGLSLGAEEHAARFYDRGMTADGILKHPSKLKRETAEAMADSFTAKWGGLKGSRKIPVLWEGMEFQTLSINNKDAEFLESRKFTVAEIARWYGIPPHLVGDVERTTSWGTGIEEQNLQFLIYSLLPDVTLWEQRVRHDLVLDPERYYASMKVDAILRASAQQRYAVYDIAIRNGILSPNECRSLEDLNPREGGDEYQTQLNMRIGSSNPATEQQALAIAHRLAMELDRPGGDDRRPAAAGPAAAARARWAVGQVLEREASELRALAERAGGSSAKFRHGLASFYGRHAALVVEALAVTLEDARAYCQRQQETINAQGLPADVGAWRASSGEQLVRLVEPPI